MPNHSDRGQTLRPRGPDRRVNTEVSPPPFLTREGVIDIERRSLLDRRADWLRQFSLPLLDPER